MNKQDNYNAFVATREAFTSAVIEASEKAERAAPQPNLNLVVSFLREGMNNSLDSGEAMDARQRLEAIKKEIAAAQAFLADIDSALDSQIDSL